jgi:hypothetical protein
MNFRSKVKGWINSYLEPLNMRLDSRTAERVETARLLALEDQGHFTRSIFPILPQFVCCDPKPVLEAVKVYRDEIKRFSCATTRRGYSFHNDYFTSPDAEVAYALVRTLRPKRIIEVGSGNSTQLFREAIEDGGLCTELVSIDPSPRKAVEQIATRVINSRLEQVPESFFYEVLESNDILFIDSSHEIRAGNDVVVMLLKIIPALKSGVVLHLHDIFLPFEYPRQWIIENRWSWNEQYLVQAMLQGSAQFSVLWPGHYLQKNLRGFFDYFDHSPSGRASSLWLRKIV